MRGARCARPAWIARAQRKGYGLRMTTSRLLVLVATAFGLAACTHTSRPDSSTTISATAADAFMARIATHCGQAFEGRIAANQPTPSTPEAFEGKTLLMHVRGCDEPARELRIPFHVGDDRSRTWVLTRTQDGLRLKHDHRHADGSDDAVTMYGGDTSDVGTPQRQSFPVDAESRAMFRKEGLDASLNNVWAMEIEPAQRFVYELARPGGRLFRVEFDLTRPVAIPPAPWGS